MAVIILVDADELVQTRPWYEAIYDAIKLYLNKRWNVFKTVMSSFRYIKPRVYLKYQWKGTVEVLRSRRYDRLMYGMVWSYLSVFALHIVFMSVFVAPGLMTLLSMILGPLSLPLTALYVIMSAQYVTMENRPGSMLNEEFYLTEILAVTLASRKYGYLRSVPIPRNQTGRALLHLKSGWNQKLQWRFWVIKVPSKLLGFVVGILLSLLAFVVSLVPVVGYLILYIYGATQKGFLLVSPYINHKLKLTAEEQKSCYHKHYFEWFTLGLIASFNDMIPIWSIFARTTNFVGYSLWELENVHLKFEPGPEDAIALPYPPNPPYKRLRDKTHLPTLGKPPVNPPNVAAGGTIPISLKPGNIV